MPRPGTRPSPSSVLPSSVWFPTERLPQRPGALDVDALSVSVDHDSVLETAGFSAEQLVHHVLKDATRVPIERQSPAPAAALLDEHDLARLRSVLELVLDDPPLAGAAVVEDHIRARAWRPARPARQ